MRMVHKRIQERFLKGLFFAFKIDTLIHFLEPGFWGLPCSAKHVLFACCKLISYWFRMALWSQNVQVASQRCFICHGWVCVSWQFHMKEQLQRHSMQEELNLFVLESFWHFNDCCIRRNQAELHPWIISSSQTACLDEDRNIIGHHTLLCCVFALGICALREHKRVPSSSQGWLHLLRIRFREREICIKIPQGFSPVSADIEHK